MSTEVGSLVTARGRRGSPADVVDAIAAEDDPPIVGSVFRAARRYRGWSLREVERRIGRDNAYLSQLERGVIRRPDPAVVLALAELYELNVDLVAHWAGLGDFKASSGTGPDLRVLLKAVAELEPVQRAEVAKLVDELRRISRT